MDQRREAQKGRLMIVFGHAREKTNEFRNTALTQLEKQPPDILTHTQAPVTLEALDNVCIPYAYGCDVPSIGPPTGVSIIPFGGVSASEEMLNLLGVPSANCSTDYSQLYLNVFQKCSEFYGGNLRRERTTTFRLVCRTQDAKLYLDVYQKYHHGCKEVLREGPSTISNGIPSVDCESQKLKSADAVDVFQAYYALCSRGIGGRRSVNVRQTTTVSSCNFIHDNGIRNTGPSISHGGRNARRNPHVSLTTGEAICSRGIGGRRYNFIHDNDVRNTGPSTSRAGINACGNPNVSLTTGEATCSRGIGGLRSNFIHDNDVHNTSHGGRNIHANLEVDLTTAQATCSSSVTRRRSVRRRPSTRGPTVGSSSASGAMYVKCVVTCFLQGPHTLTLLLETLISVVVIGSSFWYGERLKGHSHNQRPEYHLCCGRGNIYMQPPREPHEYIKSLFGNKHFMENIRAYNQMFAMTSFGAKIDESINVGRGPYVFKVSGQIYHWIGSLCPPLGEAPRFLQLYIYDTDNDVETRMRHFGGIHNSDLDPQIVEGLIHFLDAYNKLVQLFKTARDKCMELDIPEFKIRLYNGEGPRGYEFPTSNTFGAMVFESGITSNTDFDVIIQHNDDPPQRVNKLHPSYMSLQFPLIFIYGQSGYHTYLKLKSADGRGRARRITMLAYYKYQLHFCLQRYDLLFRGGRLFQQYVVGVFCVVEQNRLDFLWKKQNDIRADYLSGLYDAISRGERDGYEVGGRIILPISFTGGPRYMYVHYLDALAICRKLGNP
ncbi:DNA helicase [Tanacetum coccineum]